MARAPEKEPPTDQAFQPELDALRLRQSPRSEVTRIWDALPDRGAIQPTAAFPSERPEAETGERPRRRDTVPVPPSATGTEMPRSPTNFVAPPRSMAEGSSESTQETSAGDILDTDAGWLDGEDSGDDTLASLGPSGRRARLPHHPADDAATSPTLALANQSSSTREVYRLFLASDYAPALARANELIAQGDEDAMLVTIAGACRTSLSSAPGAMLAPAGGSVAMTFDGSMTIAEVAAKMGVSVGEVIGVFDRFVGLGLSRRPR